ncbi:DgyrCDS12392 [Dimorphilus gyrociliatus]|uniref:DgyrCDS12392 n=1 Tax=Dimorphilus gyrociliatus TaxID=2664684 RepID=A0A7I8W7A8_9ANNE|nr:DgyrCDS12392 [Dimorphilus gyrociliatus]
MVKTKKINVMEITEAKDTDSSIKDCRLDEISWFNRLSKFTGHVSIVGLRHTNDMKTSIYKKIIWTILILFGICFMTFQIQDRLTAFFKYDTVTIIKNVNNPILKFPTVTICNENEMKKSAVERDGLKKVVEVVWPPLREVKEKNKNLNLDYLRDQTKTSTEVNWGDIYARYAPSIEESIKECIFKGAFCDPLQDFRYVQTKMGKCFQFAPGNASLFISQPGVNYGLSLTLNANQSEYLVVHSPSIAFRVLVHDRTELPLMEGGLKAQPGHMVNIGVRLEKRTFLPKPYGNCNNDPNYRTKLCFLNCFSKHITVLCGCRQGYMTGNASICSPYDTLCVIRERDNFTNNEIHKQCNCSPQCFGRDFITLVTQAKLSEYFLESYVFKHKVSREVITDNYILLNIFFSSMTSTHIEEEAGYLVLKLLADVGGAFSLLLGGTILSLFEIMDFAVLELIHYIQHRKGVIQRGYQ